MTTADDGPTEDARRGERAMLLREALYGTIVLLSVLAYLADHPVGAGECLETVVGSAVMLFLAQLYAVRMAQRITATPGVEPPRLRRAAAEMWPVVAVAAPSALFLAIAATRALTTSTALTIDLWLGVVLLGAFAYAAAHTSHESHVRQALSTASGLAVGLIIVALKAAL